MSSMGTGIAAAVAQTAHQAQQVARQRDSVRSQGPRHARRMQEQIQARLLALEESEGVSPAQLHIDGQLPQFSPGDQQEPQPQKRDEAADETVVEPPTPAITYTPVAQTDKHPLYRHVDVQA